MNAAPFCAKRAGGARARVVPLDSEDSCLSDSGDSDEEYPPRPADETSSECSEDRSSSDEDAAPAPPPAADARRRRPKVAWKTVEQQNSAKEVRKQ